MSLNAQQQAAATDTAFRVSVAASPGSGKTSTLVQAVLNDIDRDEGNASKIVILTFTNAAAAEIKHRLNRSVGFIGTLHGYCLRIMRKAMPGLTLIDEHEADKLLEHTAKSLRYKGTRKALDEARAAFLEKISVMGGTTDAQRVILAYASSLVRENLLEYDLLLERTAKWLSIILEQQDPVRLFVDEFQDTADIDMKIKVLLLTERMFVVGDADQSIYRFRGANPDIFIKQHAISSQHILTTNYRSTHLIVKCANKLISHSAKRIPMLMEANSKDSQYGPPMAQLCQIQIEHDLMIRSICSMVKENYKDASIAILTRTNAEADAIRAYLTTQGLQVNDTKTETIPDLARVRTLIGLALNPKSKVLQGIEMAQRKSTNRIEIMFTPEHKAATTLKEVIATVWCFHTPSDEMKAILDTAVEVIPDDEPYLLFDHIRETRKTAPSAKGINVGTMHWSKGQEFDFVIIANADTLTQATNDDDRRLFYVAMTRARKGLWAYGVEQRYVEWKGLEEHKLSPYVEEAGFLVIK